MKEKTIRVLNSLAGSLEGFYLAGGTALSVFYFGHRESYDLDFFTKDFSKKKIEKLMSALSEASDFKITLITEQTKKDFAQMLEYSLKIDRYNSLKIDFVEDVYEFIKPLKVTDGIPVLSIEDIYLRKIFTACGSSPKTDLVGRKTFIGGRQEAKDFFDLYVLSTVFMPLSKFAAAYCKQEQVESIVVWFRTYDRVAIKLGLNDIITDKKVDYYQMERHFRTEIEQLIRQEF